MCWFSFIINKMRGMETCGHCGRPFKQTSGEKYIVCNKCAKKLVEHDLKRWK